MSLRNTLRDKMLTVWVGEPWYGASSKTIHADISAAEAASRPIAGVQNIWETTLHMIAWTEEAASRVRGNAAHEPERGDWPPMPSATTELWHETIAQLGAARQELLDALENVHEEDLYTLVPRAQDTKQPRNTRAQTASGLLEHDIYHIGQLALLKKAVRATV